MKKDEVVVGGTYSAKVGARTLDVRIDSENAKGGWNATGVNSGKPVRIKDARHIRGPAASADGERTVEQADADGGDATGNGDDDTAPRTRLRKEVKRGGKQGNAAGAPKEKASKPRPPKEKKPKAVSCLDAAAAILKAAGEPMRCKEMVAEMKEKGLWTSDAPTPEATLYSAILRELKAARRPPRFKKTDRGRFEYAGE